MESLAAPEIVRRDPAWQMAKNSFLAAWPGLTPDEVLDQRIQAAHRMHEIELSYALDAGDGDSMWRRRLLRRIERYSVAAGDCVLWRGQVNAEGYGRINTHRDGKPRRFRVHRLVYELHIGPIPDGFVIDHTCHSADSSCIGGPACTHRRCINPHHLEAVTQQVNAQRGKRVLHPISRTARTHCAHGHELNDENSYCLPSRPDRRYCRTCEENRKPTSAM